MSSPDDIIRQLDSFLAQEQRLLNQLEQIKVQQNDPSKEMKKDFVNILARGTLGRSGGKIVRTIVNQGEKQRFDTLRAQVDSQHINIVVNFLAFINTVSVWKKGLTEPNSYQFKPRLDKAQEGVKVETRIRATIRVLNNLKAKKLIYNRDIHQFPGKAMVLPPAKPFTALMELGKIFGSCSGFVKVCDTWVDRQTLELLHSIPSRIPIKLLTGASGESGRFLSALKAFKVEHIATEVRVSTEFHDRFIFTENHGWAVGSSLKDLGRKASTILPLANETRREAEKVFDDLWKKAKLV